MFEQFTQNYIPLGNVYVSAIFAAIPVVIILVMLGVLRTKAHWAALAGLVASLLSAVLFYRMPIGLAGSAAVLGALFGLWPIVWIVINALFLHNLTVETGKFDIVRDSLANLQTDRRIQAVTPALAVGVILDRAPGARATPPSRASRWPPRQPTAGFRRSSSRSRSERSSKASRASGLPWRS